MGGGTYRQPSTRYPPWNCGAEGRLWQQGRGRPLFSVSIVAGGLQFTSLHFEEFACTNRASLCNAHGCLHEVYLEAGGRHRLVFSARARDVRLSNDGGVAGIEVNYGASNQFFRWDRTRFVPAAAMSRPRQRIMH